MTRAMFISLLFTAPAFAEEPTDAEPTLYGEEFPSSESVSYVIDRSGSMSWGSSYVLMDDATTELADSIRRLPHGLAFNVVSYNCSADWLWDEPRPASGATRDEAISWVQQSSHGATGTGPAVAHALQNEPEHVVLLTDGAPNCPSDAELHYQTLFDSTNDVRFSIIGIGDYGSFAQFLQDMAESTGGTYLQVTE
jgi:hypothetical protein